MAAKPALVVVQSGGPTPVINASLAGVVAEGLVQGEIGAIVGARFGIEGVLGRELIDLRAPSAALWERIRATPSAALGSSRRKLDAAGREAALDTLVAIDARVLIFIGGNDSADTALGLERLARERGYPLRVIGVPKTIDNDLPGMDHCPGYGSAARFIAQTTQDAGLDTEAMRGTDPIKLIEVMGRDAGWLAAAASLGREDERRAPHLICVPERGLDVDRFVARIEETYRRYGHAVAVVAETVRDVGGEPIGSKNEIQGTDPFGHPTIAGAAQALTALIGRALGVKARFDKPGTIGRMCMALASPVDLQEAYDAGMQAVRWALEGRSGVMVGLGREQEGHGYACTMVEVPLERVANAHRLLPKGYLGDDPFGIDPSFAAYATPLIGPPLLRYGRLL